MNLTLQSQQDKVDKIKMFTVVFNYKNVESLPLKSFATIEDAKAFVEAETKGKEVAEEIWDNETAPWHSYEIWDNYEDFENGERVSASYFWGEN